MTQQALKRTGGCHCGAVKFEVTLNDLNVHVCHCSICLKIGGAPSLALGCSGDWTIEGEENLKWYDSSDYAQRGFCTTCGTHMLFRMKDGSYYGLGAGNIDDQSGLKIAEHIFVDSKPPYYEFADDTPRYTEEEFLKMIGAV